MKRAAVVPSRCKPAEPSNTNQPYIQIVSLSPASQAQQYLLAVRSGESPAEHRSVLASISSDDLASALNTDEQRLAFWINCYNAITQRVIAENRTGYKHRRDFFNTPHETVAGHELSLNDIEHGILRRGQHPFGMGYLRRPSRDAFLKQQQPSTLDPRIHFTLNCGAKSCPPIAAYMSEQIDEQLDTATRSYLDQHVEYDPDDDGILSRVFGPGTVTVPRVMLWYRGDFGRKRDIISFLRYYDQLPQGVWPRISYDNWDWGFDPADYAEELPFHPQESSEIPGDSTGEQLSQGQPTDESVPSESAD